MKTKHLICLAVLCGFSSSLHAQIPPLTPSGPPSDPTTAMKSLNQVEPRTIIGSLPYTISQPGSYYFAGNLEFTAATGNAITVTSDNVTIDLMGFTLSSTAPVTGHGIYIPANDNVVVTNGVIKGATVINTQAWTATPGGFARGISCDENQGSSKWHLSRLFVTGCRNIGIRALSQCTIDDCNLSKNGYCGIEVDVACLIRRCIVAQNGGNSVGGAGFGIESWGNITVTECIAQGNEGVGINAAASTVSNCAAINNGSIGIQVSNGVISFCRASSNGEPQISGGTSTRTGNFPSP